MASSQTGPHQGEIRLRSGERVACVKKWGSWQARGKWRRVGDASSLGALQRRIEAKAKASSAKPAKRGPGKPVTTFSFGQLLGLSNNGVASSKQHTKPWWW